MVQSQDRDSRRELLAPLENAVMDAVVDGVSRDTILIILIDLIMSSIYSGRPVYSNPLDEPLMYTHMLTWVTRGMEEREKSSEIMSKAETPFK